MRWIGAVLTVFGLAAAAPPTASPPAALPPAAVSAMPWKPTPSAAPAYARAAAIAALGRQLFFDPSLSASGRMSCASCHDPALGFAAPNALSVQLGGPNRRRPGLRSVPTLMYGQQTPPFTEHFFDPDEEGDESVDQGPTGGRDWDGRVDRARDQARLPLLDKNEMANASTAAVLKSVARGASAADFLRLYGRTIFSDTGRAFAAIGQALEFYQQTPAVFSPFSSKYDAFLNGRATLTAPEARGLALFNDPARGNCARCHPSAVTAGAGAPLFTDFGYAALGLPRNPAIPANADPAFFDLGLCGPERHDLAGQTQFCGMFKTPTLRNVALRKSFFHNGVFHSLRDAVAFYAERDTAPEKWYSKGKFDDLPPAYITNIDTEPPFGPARVLSDSDVDDIVAFLKTLTDGYRSAP